MNQGVWRAVKYQAKGVVVADYPNGYAISMQIECICRTVGKHECGIHMQAAYSYCVVQAQRINADQLGVLFNQPLQAMLRAAGYKGEH